MWRTTRCVSCCAKLAQAKASGRAALDEVPENTSLRWDGSELRGASIARTHAALAAVAALPFASAMLSEGGGASARSARSRSPASTSTRARAFVTELDARLPFRTGAATRSHASAAHSARARCGDTSLAAGAPATEGRDDHFREVDRHHLEQRPRDALLRRVRGARESAQAHDVPQVQLRVRGSRRGATHSEVADAACVGGRVRANERDAAHDLAVRAAGAAGLSTSGGVSPTSAAS